MKNLILPSSEESLLVRTDLSDPEAWNQIMRLISEPEEEYGFQARVSFLSDAAYEGCTPEELLEAGRRGPYRSFLFFVDRDTFASPEHHVGVLDLQTEPGRVFRVVPSEMWSVENNLSLANMDFAEFADSVDSDGVFRGFPA